MAEQRPYGTWPSSLSATMAARAGTEFGGIAVDDGTVWWLERRPDEDGRGVVLREGEDGPEAVTPQDANVRTLVHEYGGGDFAVQDGTLWYADRDDQRVYRLEPGGDPVPITPEPEVRRGLRYADLEVAPGGDRIYCVRERHFDDGREPANTLVAIDPDGDAEPSVVVRGADFYAAPRVSPDGRRVAWLSWDHPSMPFDETRLHVGEIASDGSVTDDSVVMGAGPDPESILSPTWSPEGDLYAVSDRTNWWNVFLIDLDTGDQYNCCPRDVEFGVPMWRLGYRTIAFLDDGPIAVVYTDEGRRGLGLLVDREFHEAELPYSYVGPWVGTDGRDLLFVGGTPDTPEALLRWRPGSEPSVVTRSTDRDLDRAYVSSPVHVSFPTDDTEFDAYGFYYPPTNPDVEAPEDEAPPLLVTVHGGPTSRTHATYDPQLQYFTTRGIAVMDVNYRGSTGYGRKYRERLDGQWGVADVVDCVRAATYLAETDRADPDRMAIRGGSAGGYATLCALAFHDAFDAGTSYYGVAELAALARNTHKFESRYLDGLIGPYPEREELYRERSPAHHADGIDVPVLLLQGEDDPVVPPEHAETTIERLESNGVPYSYVTFEDERHGFRKAENVAAALEAELSFLGQVFGFEPADDLPGVDLIVE